ncbi:hypothetical protein [Pseudomonas koreensis]|uniref:Uncharacterized protein n=1 Tax=Pseudomonas koreensis TaxID=198620 RepID=A0AA94ER20_9PSED|nr:hypothetical protein [Pseudomonas koreensis]RVD78148.1 hypothetical protein A9HBioS_1993 [Pseudomonas koreensis]
MEIDWGSVADWASAFGSVSAALVALYLAKSSQRVNLTAFCGIRIIVGGGFATEKLASIMVTNTGDRPFKISSITIRHGVIKKQHGFIKIGAPTEHCESLLRLLNDGDQAHFGFPLEDVNNWVSAMARDCRTDLDIATIRLTIHCSNGQSLKFKPEKPLLDFIRAKMRMLQNIDVKIV